MRESRTLRLRKERLTELSAEEMGGVVGGTNLGCAGAADATQTILPVKSCIGLCATDPRVCTTR